MLHKGAHALAVARGVQDSSAESNRYHNKRFVALVTEIGQVCRLTDETSAAYADVISAIDSARLPSCRRSRRSAA